MDVESEIPPAGGDIQMDAKVPEQNKLAAILAYIGPLVIVSYIIGKDDPLAKFHIKQGLALLVAWVVVWFAASTFWWFGLAILWNLVKVALFALSLVGIVFAVQGKEKAPPLVGSLSKYFSF